MNSENSKVSYSSLKNYFENKASQEEAALVGKWLENPENTFKYEKKLHNLWDEMELSSQDSEVDFEALLHKVHHSINSKSGKMTKVRTLPQSEKSNVSLQSVIRNLGRIAAVFLVPLLAYVAWEITSQSLWEKNQTAIVYNEIKCPLGAKSQFVLPDGTTGSLNNGSSLKYPVKFTGDTREVELKGEAFFDVEHIRQRPFIISTAGLDVKVLGTRLNVYSYPNEDYQEVTLESGEIELIQRRDGQETSIAKMKPGQHVVYRFEDSESGRKDILSDKDLVVIENKEEIESAVSGLRPGKQALFQMEEGNLFLEKDEPERYTGWTDGKLILRNDPMPVLLKRMERWYSVKFNIEDERINEYTYWATFEEENIDQVLNLLSLTGPVKFTKLPRDKNPDGTFKIQEIKVSIRK